MSNVSTSSHCDYFHLVLISLLECFPIHRRGPYPLALLHHRRKQPRLEQHTEQFLVRNSSSSFEGERKDLKDRKENSSMVHTTAHVAKPVNAERPSFVVDIAGVRSVVDRYIGLFMLLNGSAISGCDDTTTGGWSFFLSILWIVTFIVTKPSWIKWWREIKVSAGMVTTCMVYSTTLFMCIGWLTVIFANLGFVLGVLILLLLFCRCLINEYPVGITLDGYRSAFLFCGCDLQLLCVYLSSISMTTELCVYCILMLCYLGGVRTAKFKIPKLKDLLHCVGICAMWFHLIYVIYSREDFGNYGGKLGLLTLTKLGIICSFVWFYAYYLDADVEDDKSTSRRSCDGCGSTINLKRCSCLLDIFYCSTRCQKRAWPRHRAACTAARST